MPQGPADPGDPLEAAGAKGAQQTLFFRPIGPEIPLKQRPQQVII